MLFTTNLFTPLTYPLLSTNTTLSILQTPVPQLTVSYSLTLNVDTFQPPQYTSTRTFVFPVSLQYFICSILPLIYATSHLLLLCIRLVNDSFPLMSLSQIVTFTTMSTSFICTVYVRQLVSSLTCHHGGLWWLSDVVPLSSQDVINASTYPSTSNPTHSFMQS